MAFEDKNDDSSIMPSSFNLRYQTPDRLELELSLTLPLQPSHQQLEDLFEEFIRSRPIEVLFKNRKNYAELRADDPEHPSLLSSEHLAQLIGSSSPAAQKFMKEVYDQWAADVHNWIYEAVVKASEAEAFKPCNLVISGLGERTVEQTNLLLSVSKPFRVRPEEPHQHGLRVPNLPPAPETPQLTFSMCSESEQLSPEAYLKAMGFQLDEASFLATSYATEPLPESDEQAISTHMLNSREILFTYREINSDSTLLLPIALACTDSQEVPDRVVVTAEVFDESQQHLLSTQSLSIPVAPQQEKILPIIRHLLYRP
ncbi:MAG: hypothetical protein ACQEQU_04245 [Spirochaetota bacterium]